MKTYLKTFSRMFRRHATRLVSVVLIVLVSIGFTAGIGMTTDKMHFAYDEVYSSSNMSDLIVKSTCQTGLNDSEIALLEKRYGADNVQVGSSFEFDNAEMATETTAQSAFGEVTVNVKMTFSGIGNGVTRVYFFDTPPTEFALNSVNVIETANRPAYLDDDVYGVWVERETAQKLNLSAGDVGTLSATVVRTVSGAPINIPVTTDTYRFYVAGVIKNPLHFATKNEVSVQFQDEDGKRRPLESIFYVADSELSPAARDVYIKLNCPNDMLVMSSAYESFVEKEKAALEELLTVDGQTDAVVLTLFENYSAASFHNYAEKIEAIGFVLMFVFLLVTLLVVLSTMTRLLDEERAQIACLSTLGYSSAKILTKYVLFALVGTLIGIVGGYFAGLGLAYVVYANFQWNFMLPPFPARISLTFYAAVSAVILIATVAATIIAGVKKTHERPAEILRPKAPKPGKKILLERIPSLWNRFSFKYKSTLRNVFRYKVRFAMTVIAVMASTALVVAGLAVLDCCLFQDVGTSAMIIVGIIVLVFAALLNFVIIFTLTNINISERTRELSTLMVLGYHDNEVAGYVYREIYITGIIGIVLGIPVGLLLCRFIFSMMVLGSLAAVNVYVWFVAPLISLLFIFLVTVMLRGKIIRINMNDSLKAME